MSTYTVGSCFAGIGGIDLGLEATGRFRTVWHSEVNPAAARVLAHRFPDAEPWGDIRAMVEPDLFGGPPHVDVLVGGPPCQGVSKGNAYGRRGLADPRSALFYVYVELLAQLRPRFVVMEQVTGLLTSNGGRDWAAVLASFERVGYAIAAVAQNSLAYVPQTRSRIYLVGCHRPDAATAALLPVSADGACHPGAYRATAWQRAANAADRVGEGRVYRKGRRARNDQDGETWVHGAYANTLTLHDIGPSRATVIVVDDNGDPRVMTPVEWERCHGYPDNWTVAAGTDAARWALLGNAVSPPVAERIGEGLAEAWEGAA